METTSLGLDAATARSAGLDVVIRAQLRTEDELKEAGRLAREKLKELGIVPKAESVQNLNDQLHPLIKRILR